MGIVETLVLSCSLAVDATTVSITNGLCNSKLQKRKIFLSSAIFGLFQGLMPLIGYYLMSLTSLNEGVDNVVKSVDHWIALALLTFLGGKMIFDGIKEVKNKDDETVCDVKNNLSIGNILLQGVATSIDALAVGISLYASINVPNYTGLSIWLIVPCIIVITFLLALIGGLFGKKIGSAFKKIAPFVGGFVLIIIGISILIEHIG